MRESMRPRSTRRSTSARWRSRTNSLGPLDDSPNLGHLVRRGDSGRLTEEPLFRRISVPGRGFEHDRGTRISRSRSSSSLNRRRETREMSIRRSAGLFRGRSLIVVLALALVAAVTAAAGGAASSARHHGKAVAGSQSDFGIIDVSRNLGRNSRVPVEVAKGKFKPLRTAVAQQRKLRLKHKGRSCHDGTPAAVGDARTWIALDDTNGFYLKQYVLK